jgi:hypothetical protein
MNDATDQQVGLTRRKRRLPLLLYVLGVIGAMSVSAQAQAVVGRAVYYFAQQPGHGDYFSGSSTNYTVFGSLMTNNGLVIHWPNLELTGNAALYGGYIDLNDLTVNLASTPVPTGRLSLSKVIGKNGDQVVVSWKLD